MAKQLGVTPVDNQELSGKPPVSPAPASEFRIRLLGGFEVLGPDRQPVQFPVRKACALLALLALRAGESVSRDRICELLWADVPPAQARHSLRQSLVCLRKLLPDLIVGNSHELALETRRAFVDVIELERSLAIGTREALSISGALYRGELLEGFALRERTFDSWLRAERGRLRNLTIHGFTQLVELHAGAGDTPAALEACTRLLQLDPLREQAHRSAMRLLTDAGDRASAIDHYRKLASLLRAELGSEPDAETQQLYAELAAGPLRECGFLPSRRLSAVPARPEVQGIARHDVLAALRDARSRALTGSANIFVVRGEAGVGKTHLCDQLARELEPTGAPLLRARCFESEQVLPFALWSNWLSDTELENSASGAHPSDVQAVFRALDRQLACVADAAGLTLILEDLHWADEMSVRALCYLARRRPALFVITLRPEDAAAGSFLGVALAELEQDHRLTAVTLEPLPRAEADELALRWARHLELSVEREAWLEQVWSIGEGNPFVIVETAHACTRDALGQELERLPIPDRVRALILRRVRALSRPARELLRVGAVNGREFDPAIARGLLGESQLVTAAEELTEHALLCRRGEFLTFTHDRIRETVYAEMLPLRRRTLHAYVAESLERLPGPRSTSTFGKLGFHYSKAGNAGAAVRYLLRFAERARRGHALGEALTALEHALSDSAALPDAERAQACVEIAINMAFCFAFLGKARELVTLLTRHAGELERLTRSEFVPQYHFWWAFGLTVLGDTPAAEQHARFSLEHATARDDCRGIGFSHGILSYLCWLNGRWIEGVQHGTKAMELAVRELEIPEAPVLAAVNTHMNYLWLGDWQAALAAVRQAAASADRADSQRCRAIAAFAESLVYSHIERWEPALEAAQRALEASNTPLTRVHALWVLARAQIGTGEPKPALAVLEPMLAQLDPAPHLRVPLLTTLAEARLCDGDASSAQRMAAEALAGARSVSYSLPQGAALRVHGAADLAMGRLASARVHLEAAVSTFEACAAPIEQARARLCLADLNLALQDREAALSQLQRAGALFREHSVEQGERRVSERMAQLSGA